MFQRLYIFVLAVFMTLVGAVSAFADGSGLTIPTLSTSDLSAAGTAILGLIAVAVTIGVVIRIFKRA